MWPAWRTWPSLSVTLATSAQVTPSSAATASTLTASLPVGCPVVPGWSPDCVVPCRVVLVLAVVLVLSAGELRPRHPAPPCPGASSHRRAPPHRRPPPRRHSHVGCRLTSRHRQAGLCRAAGHVHAAGQLYATDHHFAAGHDSKRRPQGTTVPPASAVPPATTLPPAVTLLPAAATCRRVAPSCRRPRRLPSAADHPPLPAATVPAASIVPPAGNQPLAPARPPASTVPTATTLPPVITFSSASGSPLATLSTSVVSATGAIFPWALSAPLAAPTK